MHVNNSCYSVWNLSGIVKPSYLVLHSFFFILPWNIQYSRSFPELQDFNVKSNVFPSNLHEHLARGPGFSSLDNAEYLPADLWPVCCVSRSVDHGQGFPPRTSACSLICLCYTMQSFFLLLLVRTSTSSSKGLCSKWEQHNHLILSERCFSLWLSAAELCCHNKPSSNPWQSPCLST